MTPKKMPTRRRRAFASSVAFAVLAMLGPSASLCADVRISELMYAPVDPTLEFVELVNDGEQAVDVGGWAITNGVQWVFPDAVTIAAGGRVVIARDRLALRAATDIDNAILFGPYGGALANGGERVTLSDETLIVVETFRYDDETPWDPSADGTDRSLERVCLSADASLPGNWRASLVDGGTPGAENGRVECPPPPPGVFSAVVITEIYYHPANDRDVTDEFVELHNRTDEAVDLDGWALTNGVELVFDRDVGPTVIAPRGYLLAAGDPTSVAALSGVAVEEIAGPWSGKLSNYRDEVELVDEFGRRADIVEYRQDGLWPARADGLGSSLQRVSTEYAGALPQNWKVAFGSACQQDDKNGCVVFDTGSEVRWFESIDGTDPGFSGAVDWFDPDFDDEANSWRDGRLGIGYDTNPAEIPTWVDTRTTVSAGLHSILIRIEFTWDPAGRKCSSDLPHLWVDRDDGFVAWLNGVEVARRGMDDPTGVVPPFDGSYRGAIYTAGGVNAPAPEFELVWQGDASDLRTGRNVLAIGNYNSRNTSSDLYISTSMTLGRGAAVGDLTAGAPNSVASPTLPPLVLDVEHEPAEPVSTDVVMITAGVEAQQLDEIEVVYDAGGGEQSVLMVDDGSGDDATASDGIFTATLPRQPNDTLVKYRIEARAGDGCASTFPPLGNPSPWTGYYVQNDRPPTDGDDVRLFYIFTPGALADLSCSSGVRRSGTFVDFRGRAYFDVGVKFRGETACNYPKKPIRVRFNRGDLFDDQNNLNFSAGWNDKAMLREKFGFDFFRDAGVAYSECHLARVHTNDGRFHGAFFTVEDPSDDYLRRNDWDDDGALYKSRSAILNGATGGYEPRSSSAAETLADVSRFATDLNRLSGQPLIDFLNAELDVEAFLDYQVVQAIIIDGDSVVKNWLLYRGPHGHGRTGADRFMCFAWDIDLSHGQMYLTRDQRHHTIHPLFHTRTHPFVGQGHHGIVNAVLERAPNDYYVKAHYGRMWALLHEKYSPDVLYPRLDAYDVTTLQTVRDDLARWRRTWGARGDDPDFWRQDFRNWVQRRFDFLSSYLVGNNPTTGGRRFQYTPAPRLRFTEIHYNPFGNEDFEFFEIRNLEGGDVDIAGWTIPAIDYEFPAGSVAPAGGFLIVARNPVAFGVTHPRMPDGVNVFGPYVGRLSNAGEELRLRDTGEHGGTQYFPETIDVVRYDDDEPWPTEADGDGKTLELVDLDLDNDYAESWQPSLVDHGSPGRLTIDNLPPVLRLTTSATSGAPPLRVEFDASGSFDPDGDALTVRWDFGDGVIGAGEMVARTYRNPGVFIGSVTLDDEISLPTVQSFEIRVGGSDGNARFVRGDVVADGDLDIGDPVAILFGLFLGGELDCEDAADANDDERLGVDDAVYLLAYLFRLEAPPADPFGACGEDPVGDALGCQSAPLCN